MEKNATRGKPLLITGPKVWVHNSVPHAAERDLLIVDGRIAAVEPAGSIAHDPPAGTEIMKLPGGLILPAFFDGHLHLEMGGKMLNNLQLLEVHSSNIVLEKIAGAAKHGNGWIIGIGLREDAWPTLDDLNRVSRGRPLLVHTRDYHSAILNAEGIAAIGLTGDTPMPHGGWMELNENNVPNGILRENAVTWVEGMLPEETESKRMENLDMAFRHLVGSGVLGVSDAGHLDGWSIYRELERNDELPLRIESWFRCLSLNQTCLDAPRGVFRKLRRTRIKLFVDGALGSGTAWMREPLSDAPKANTTPIAELDAMKDLLEAGVKRGWSFAVHAIGDEAVNWILDTLNGLDAPGGAHRIEHFQHITDSSVLSHPALERIIPSIQPLHRLEDEGMLLSRVGKRRAGLSFPARSLWRKDRPLALGTDWPIVPADPLKTVYAAIRRRKNDTGMPGEELTLAEALFCATRGSALAAGFSDTGAIAPGLEADLVWMENNPGDNSAGWEEAEVTMVLRSGETVYSALQVVQE